MSSPKPSHSFDPALIRQQFPLINNSSVVYLDNAATTQKPRSVISAIEDYYQNSNANVHRAAHQLSARATQAYEAARETVKNFINASSGHEIIWTTGATESINLVANSYGNQNVGPGDEILLSLMEHHSNIVPWQLLAQRTGASLRVVPLTEQGDLDMTAYQSLLNEKTRIVALTQVSNSLGTINPIKACIKLAHQVGAIVLVDGAQAVSHMAVDVQELGCDFYVFSGHKMFGPTGIGVLYGRAELLTNMPPWKAGGEMIEKVSFSGTTFNRLPFKFEAGTPNIAGAIGLGKAIQFLSALDRTAINTHENRLLDTALNSLSTIKKLRIIGQPTKRIGLIPFTIDGFHTFDLGTLLDQQGIAIRTGHHCTMPLMDSLKLPEGTARASFSLYNTVDEVHALARAIEQVVNPVSVATTSTTTADLTNTVPGDVETQTKIEPKPANQNLPANSPDEYPIRKKLIASRSWQSRYSIIMKLGKSQIPAPDGLRCDENLVHGCTSQVWLTHQYCPKEKSLTFFVDSDARVIRGLALVLLEPLAGQAPEEIYRFNIDEYFNPLGLIQHLSPSRSNGIMAIMEEIRRISKPLRD